MELGNDGLYHQAATLKRLDDGRRVRQHSYHSGSTHQVDVLPPVQGVMVGGATRRRDLSAYGFSVQMANRVDHGQRH